jgi:hypothetical protein
MNSTNLVCLDWFLVGIAFAYRMKQWNPFKAVWHWDSFKAVCEIEMGILIFQYLNHLLSIFPFDYPTFFFCFCANSKLIPMGSNDDPWLSRPCLYAIKLVPHPHLSYSLVNQSLMLDVLYLGWSFKWMITSTDTLTLRWVDYAARDVRVGWMITRPPCQHIFFKFGFLLSFSSHFVESWPDGLQFCGAVVLPLPQLRCLFI